MTPDTARLRALAEAATPGPWEHDESNARVLRCDPRATIVCNISGGINNPDVLADGVFIAAANPVAILALLDTVPVWQPIESAPKDGTAVLVWAAPRDGLSGFAASCAYHPEAGWCVCELRHVTHWMPLPTPPQQETTDDE